MRLDSSSARYVHTQIGWVILVVFALLGGVAVTVMSLSDLHGPLIAFGVISAVVLSLFGWLTVSVSTEALRFRFGIGLIRKTIPIEDIRWFGTVRNRWYYGWGIRLTPHGVLYNVSGLDAIEVALKSGKRLRIGTDQPEEVRRALVDVLGEPEPLTAQEEAARKRSALVWGLVIGAIILGVVGLVGVSFQQEMKPIEARVGPASIEVESFMYDRTVPYAEITEVSLESRLPRIRVRTNGFALGGTLRGSFRLDQLGDGMLFVEARHPPFVLVRTRDSYLVFNFEDAERTQAKFSALQRARGH